jgi:hypothetical protein
MGQDHLAEVMELPAGKSGQAQEQIPGDGALSARAAEFAHSLLWVPPVKKSPWLAQRLHKLEQDIRPIFSALGDARPPRDAADEWLRLHAHLSLLRAVAAQLAEAEATLAQLAQVQRTDGAIVPRVVALADDLLSACNYRFLPPQFCAYVRTFQQTAVLDYRELWELVLALKLVMLEKVVEQARLWLAGEPAPHLASRIHSLREMVEASWKELLQPLIVFDQVLMQDPAGAYGRMDAESRELYRRAVVHMAQHSDCSEVQIAEAALELAREAQREPESDPRLAARLSHVGCYLVAEGRTQLYRRANVRQPFHDRLQNLLRRYPDDFYFAGLEILTLGITIALVWRLEDYSLSRIFLAAVALLLPCSQSALEVMNYLMTSLLRPQILPKLDFQRGVPDECLTMVVVPTLLFNEQQVRRLVDDLEVRYLGNLSPNLHFALLTDLPDALERPEENDPLVHLCGRLIRGLNEKYAGNGAGRFAMFHRHRVYNPREGAWMGWERKRGKLLDFNKLILGDYDSFPYKAGEFAFLPRVRYVLTLDVDTELPRGAAQRLVGTLAHPLCQAIIDRQRNVVVEGYGILQPRVGVSVHSAAQSRLASIYSGQTGFDIYTRAVSDVYQDLYGEGTFAGKGICEVRTLHQVLDHRFPRNALLSHDLIEGAYTRAGLVSDVEVIDHYPSHYSAYIRRKHRWLRGDWQIVEWLFARVPDESGRRVPNPISFLSRWKILDNLRRSVIEPATLALLVLGWTVLPGSPTYWTLATLAILFVPPWVQFAFGAARGLLTQSPAAIKDALSSLGAALVNILLTLTFLVHNALVSADAIGRVLYRRMVSRQRLLEWETAAQAESGISRHTTVDLYLTLTPVLAVALGAVVFFVRRPALPLAIPILLLWIFSKLITVWLDRPLHPAHQAASRENELFLRRAALGTWHYFAEHSNAEHNWLIPDNVQGNPPKAMASVSPTNIGVLLNARQAAWELGYLTAPECVEQTLATLQTMQRMERYRGHFLNWYDTHTAAALRPRFVSTVDSGNLAASLFALKHGCTVMLERPLLSPALRDGYDDCVGALIALRALSSRAVRHLRRQKKLSWLELFFAPDAELAVESKRAGAETGTAEARWFAGQLRARKHAVQEVVRDYLPWLLPEFAPERQALSISGELAERQIPLKDLPAWIDALAARLQMHAGSAEANTAGDRLLELLPSARAHAVQLAAALRRIAAEAENFIVGMDFGFLLHRPRNLLCIGYDVEGDQLHSSCYDLLASEARTATFIAIAKGDVSQRTWFALGRPQMRVHGRLTLLSWTGTMFEYLMPALWMRSYPNTLLGRTMQGAVQAQQAYAAEKHIPWGISESACSELADSGAYHYRAFGVPTLALHEGEPTSLVVAPYASMLALGVDAGAAVENLQWMARQGLLTAYGFYEAADFTQANGRRRQRFEIVHSWMTHHQGMGLLAIVNFLRDGIFQQWFHQDARVQAADLLLQERPVPYRVLPPRQSRPATPKTKPRPATDKPLAVAG